MRFKRGVSLFGIRPELITAMVVADSVYRDFVGQECTVTSVTDGSHGSIVHSLGCAFDLRTRYENESQQWLMSTKDAIAKEMRERLTDEFDVVVESDHIHVELDRRSFV